MVAISFGNGGVSMELTVGFLVRETGVVVDKRFDSYIACRNFVNRCRHSRKVQLIFYPTFRD